MKVLFVCRANAGRSQMAEAYYNAMTKTQDACSAGLDLGNSVKGEDPTVPEMVVEVMKEEGLDVSHNRRDALSEEMVNAADKVVVITDYPLPDYLATSPKLELWEGIPDAVRTPIEFHRQVRDMVKKKVEEMVAAGR
jgi:arsenate reductase